ncbi:MAG: AAA family ATPase [Methylovulum sp.]|nr:AAA family ATPase [Methylovulum sp.]
MDYWLVRAKWGGVENKKAEFINNDEWVNGYTDKYLDIVNRVQVEDVLLLAEESTITHYGVCTENYQDGRHLLVDKWILLREPVVFPAKGAYIKTIVKVNDEDLINAIKQEIEKTLVSNDIKIKSISIENFTVFNKEDLVFSDGLNMVIGENSTGKSHLLKLLYTLMLSLNSISDNDEAIQDAIQHEYEGYIPNLLQDHFMNIFKPDDLNSLISNNKKGCLLDINLGEFSINFELIESEYVEDIYHIEADYYLLPSNFFQKNCVFIPAKEMLSFYEGFVPLYETRETSFDEIYYNLARALSLSALKNIQSYPVESQLLTKLEEILEGKIVLERGRFYLVSTNGHKTEIALIAEGLRKIATIAQLIANGSLTKNSILFWDEPEANLNPRLIKKMAELLIELSRAGMQLFIATHSLFLVKEIEILRTRDDQLRYFGLGFKDKAVRVSQSGDFEGLDDIVILDEELAQDDRFLNKQEG